MLTSALSLSEGRTLAFQSSIEVYSTGVANSVDQVTVTATPTANGAAVTIGRSDHNAISIDTSDADSDTAGHQVSLEVGFNLVTVTVTNGGSSRNYRVVVGRESLEARGWKAVDDFESIAREVSAEDEQFRDDLRTSGIWSDGTTMWVAVSSREINLPNLSSCGDPPTAPKAKLYAYSLANKTRDPTKDFTELDCENSHIGAIWSNETTMWVSDHFDGRLYAYRMSDKSRDADKDFDLLVGEDNVGGWGLWSNGTTMWVADVHDDRIYAYRMSDTTHDPDKDFDLEALDNNFGTPRGLWSNGTTMWVVTSAFDEIRAFKMSDKSRDPSKDYDLDANRNFYPRNLWSDGDTMWVSHYGGDDHWPPYRRLAKIHSYEGRGIGTAPIVPPGQEPGGGGTVSFSAASQNAGAGEGDGTIDFTIELSQTPDRTVSVSYETSGGTATEGVDYTRARGTLRIPANTRTGTISVTLREDDLDEDDETFTLTLTGATNASLSSTPSRNAATGTIRDNDGLPELSIQSDATGVEGRDPIQFRVTLSPASGREVTVTYAIAGVTATQGTDYTTPSPCCRLTFAPGDTKEVISIALPDDMQQEDAETFTVTLSSPSNATLSTSTSTGTIVDDDGPPSLSFKESHVKVSERAGRIRFTVTLVPSSGQEVTVSYATSDGTATSGDDFVAITDGTLTFSPGTEERSFDVTVRNDSLDEEDEETFTVELSDATNGDIVGSTATGTIEDDDPLPEVSIRGGDVEESDSGAEITFTVTLSRESGRTVTVDYETVGDSASPNDDFTPIPTTTLTFNPGETSKTVTVMVLDHDLNEGSETFAVELSNPSNATLSSNPKSAQGTIRNDDPLPVLSFVSDNVSRSEGSAGIDFQVRLGSPSGQHVTVRYQTADGTARQGEDYTAISPSRVLGFAPGETEKTISVSLKDDEVFEGNEGETFTLRLTSPTNATVPADTATGTITENDTESTTVQLTLNPTTISEGDGSEAVLLEARLNASTRTVNSPVRITVAGSGQQNRVGFNAVNPFTITIPARSTSARRTFTLTPQDDSDDEDDETVTVSGSNDDLTVNSATITLTDNDGSASGIRLSVRPRQIDEDDGATTVTVTAWLDGDPQTSSIAVAITAPSSTATDDVGFTTSPSNFSIPIDANSQSGEGTFTLTPVDDDIVKGRATLDVTGIATGGFSVSGAQVWIDDDDRPSTTVRLSLDQTSISEGDGSAQLMVTATLNGSGRAQSTPVNVTVQGSGAVGVVGFTASPNPFSIQIPPGDKTGEQTFTITPRDNEITERGETVTLVGSTPVPGLAVEPVTLALQDDDGGAPIGTGGGGSGGGGGGFGGLIPRPPAGPLIPGQLPEPESTDPRARLRYIAGSLTSGLGSAFAPWLAPTAAKFVIWTDKRAYQPGGDLVLYRSTDPMGDEREYTLFLYQENIETGERRYLTIGSPTQEPREDLVDHAGMSNPNFRAAQLEPAERRLTWSGPAPEAGLWHFVAELRSPDAPQIVKKAFAKFLVAATQVTYGSSGLTREITAHTRWNHDTVYTVRAEVSVQSGATLTIEPGAVVQATGSTARIVVEKGGRIEANGRREAPVVMTCEAKLGVRSAGCWGGLVIRGNAPVDADDEAAGDSDQDSEPAYGGDDPNDSSGSFRHVRVEFAGASSDTTNTPAAIGLHGVGAGTVIDHVQVHRASGDGIEFRGGTSHCGHCVVSGAGDDSLGWSEGWQGTVQHLYIQQGPEGDHGVEASAGDGYATLDPPVPYNATFIGGGPLSDTVTSGDGMRLDEGATVMARNVVLTGFGGAALDIRGTSVAPFMGGSSSIRNVILHGNGNLQGAAQIKGGIASYIRFRDEDPTLINVRYEGNPDPRPKSGSPTLEFGAPAGPPSTGSFSSVAEYIGAFGAKNWLEEWTFFGPELDYVTPDAN